MQHPMKAERLYELLMKERQGKLLADEQAELAGYRASQGQEVQIVERMMTSTENLVFPTAQETNAGWQAVLTEIERDEPSSAPIVDEPSKVRTMWPRRIMQIAAAGLLLIGAYFLLNRGSDTILTSSTTDLEELLADGSSVTLHGQSTATIKRGFSQSHRQVALEGQGYFDIVKHEHPFQVKSPTFHVEVLGTQFNVFDKPGAEVSTVSLFEGRIKLDLPTGESIELQPGDHVAWSHATNTWSKRTTPLNQPNWKQGQLVFKDTPFEEVFAQLSNEFDVSFKGTELLDGKHFNHTGPIGDLDAILSGIEKSWRVKIRKSGSTYVIKRK